MENKNDWNEALSQQENDRQAADDADTKRYGEQVMSDFDNLVSKGNQRRAESRRMKDATLSAMILQARNSNGYVPPDVLDAASENMGFRVAGGNFDKNGNFILYGLQQGEDGSAQMAPVAIASPGMQLQTLSRAKMGMDYQREIYDGLSRRYTPEQLEKRGYANPDSPQVVGSTTMSGSAARRLFGMGGPERRGISSFSADGKGGFTRSAWDGNGNSIEQNSGTRADGAKGSWKVLRSGFISEEGDYGKVYENDKTGDTVFVRRGETPPWLPLHKQTGGTDKMAIEQMKQDGLDRRAAGQNAVKLEIAKLTGEQRKEIADANNVLKKYGIDIGLEKTKENNESRERIAVEREKGRQARAVLRDKQAWEKLSIEWEKVDNSFAVQMKKADTYGKRVDLIEQKIDKDYEVALKKVKNEEDRLALDEAYKNAKLDLEEGRLDLDWLKVDSAAEQKELDRQNALKIAELRAKATSAGKSGAVAPSRLKEINSELDAYGKILKAPYDEENRKKAIDGITRLTRELHMDGGKMSSDGGTEKKVSYNDLKPGQTFVAKGKDGQRHRFRKTQNGYERID